MRAKEFLLEYDRARAAQAIGPNLWKAALRDRLSLVRIPLKNFDRAFELLYPAAFRSYGSVLTNTDAQQNLADETLEELEKADPTTNKKYTQWLGRMFASDPYKKLEDMISTAADYLYKFNKLSLKKMLKPEHTDINRFKDLKTFMDAVDQYELPDDDANRGQAEKPYADSEVTVIIPKDEASACAYGRQTRWCTAAVHGMNYFDHYNSQGTIYILIPKNPEYSGEKYQLHFPSQQFMNEDDEPADISWLLKTRFPQLLEFFMQREGDKLTKFLAFAPENIIKPILDGIAEIMMEKVNDILGEMETEDDHYYTWLRDNGYTVDDEDIDWEKVPSYFDYNPDAEMYYNLMVDSVTLTPAELQKATIEYIKDDPDRGQPTIEDIEHVIYHYIYENAPEGYVGELRRYLNDHVLIRVSRTGEYTVVKAK